ncbi:MAG: GNAT family protein [Bacteroidota bacterium]
MNEFETILKGEKCFLRAMEPEDASLLYQWENDTRYWLMSNTVAPFSESQLVDFIATARYDLYAARQLRLMIATNQKPAIGCIDLFEFDPVNMRAGVGILIADEEERNKGIAADALNILLHYCFQFLHLNQLFTQVIIDNEASLQLFKKAGFEISGTKKQWVRQGKEWKDVQFLQKINR